MNFKIKLQKRFHWDFQQNIYWINNLIFGNWLLKKYLVFPSSNLVISPKKQNSIPSNNMEYFSINSVPPYVPQWAWKLLMFISRVFIIFVAFLDVVFLGFFFVCFFYLIISWLVISAKQKAMNFCKFIYTLTTFLLLGLIDFN